MYKISTWHINSTDWMSFRSVQVAARETSLRILQNLGLNTQEGLTTGSTQLPEYFPGLTTLFHNQILTCT